MRTVELHASELHERVLIMAFKEGESVRACCEYDWLNDFYKIGSDASQWIMALRLPGENMQVAIDRAATVILGHADVVSGPRCANPDCYICQKLPSEVANEPMCPANGLSCSFIDCGPNKEIQCRYCGEPAPTPTEVVLCRHSLSNMVGADTCTEKIGHDKAHRLPDGTLFANYGKGKWSL